MGTLESEAAEWQAAQRERLPAAMLPCRNCRMQSEVKYDAPDQCPNCGAPFLGKPSQIGVLVNILIFLFCVGFLWMFFYWIRTDSRIHRMVPYILTNPAIFFFVSLALVIPFIRFLLSGASQSAAGVAAGVAKPTRARERWAGYTSAILGMRDSSGRIGDTVISIETIAWLDARTLLEPYCFVRDRYWDYLPKFDTKLSANMRSLVYDLHWVDGFLYCAWGGHPAGIEDKFKGCGSDSPALLDFVTRIKKTVGADFKNAFGIPLLTWIAERTSSTAPRLKELLTWETPAAKELYAAALGGDLVRVKALLDAEPDLLSSRHSKGFSPLHAAAVRDREQVARLLLARNINVNDTEEFGNTALHMAAVKGHTDMAELLLTNNANVDAKNSESATPLWVAAEQGRRDTVKLLLAHHAKVDAASKDGSTPLWMAAYRGHKEVAELLLASNANVNAKHIDGPTPLWAAEHQGQKHVVELLRQHGARK